MEKLKNFSVKLTKDQFEVIAPLLTKAGYRWAGAQSRMEDFNPFDLENTPEYIYLSKNSGNSIYWDASKSIGTSCTYASLLKELKGIVSPAKRKKPKVSKPIEYKLGDRYLNFDSLTPFKKGTILKKGQLVVLIKGGSEELPLGIIMQVDEDNNTCPYLLPKHSNGERPFKSTHRLAPLPTNITIRHGGLTASAKKSKAPKFKRKWTIKKTATSNDGIRIEEGVVYISLPNVSDIEIAREHLKLLYGKIGSAMKTIDNELN